VVKADEPVRAGPHGATAACEGDDGVVKAEYRTNGKYVGTTGKRATRSGSARDGIRGPAAIEPIALGSGRFSFRSVGWNEDRALSGITTRARSACAASRHRGSSGAANSGDDLAAPAGAGCRPPNSLVRRLTTLVRCSPTWFAETLLTETLGRDAGERSSPASRRGFGGLSTAEPS